MRGQLIIMVVSFIKSLSYYNSSNFNKLAHRSMALMHDYVRRTNFTTKPRLQGKFSAFALFVRGYSFQIYCVGTFFYAKLRNFTIQNEAWWRNLLI